MKRCYECQNDIYSVGDNVSRPNVITQSIPIKKIEIKRTLQKMPQQRPQMFLPSQKDLLKMRNNLKKIKKKS